MTINCLLIVEYITGGGMADSELPANLVVEAQLMLNAVVSDLQALGGIHIKLLRDMRLSSWALDNANRHLEPVFVTTAQEFDLIWHQQIQCVDAVLVIAPETDDILAKMCVDVERTEKLLLNSSSYSVNLAASKLKTSDLLRAHGLPVIETRRLHYKTDWSYPLVVKPDDGVGCDGIVIVEDQQFLDDLVVSTKQDKLVMQPWLTGQAASLSVIFYQQGAFLLTCNQQHIIVEQGRVYLTGCQVGVGTEYHDVYLSFVSDIAACMPGLRGYVGIDVIETDSGPVIVEINPRLTTSYAGLHEVIGQNPAELILQSFQSQSFCPESKTNQSIKPVGVELGSDP